MSTGEPLRLLTEIDLILDTRLGLMDSLDPASAVRLIDNPGYFTRQEDHFEALCGFPDHLYQEAWRQRDVTAMRHALQTGATDLVHYSVMRIEHQAITDPTVSGCLLDINLYPYRLTQAERAVFHRTALELFGHHTPIRLIEEPMSAFTPERVKQDYAGMLLYNYNQWLDTHQSALFASSIGIPAVTLVAPKIAKDRMPAPEAYDFRVHGVKRAIDPFEASAHMLTQYINLEFIEVFNVCIAVPGVGAVPGHIAPSTATP